MCFRVFPWRLKSAHSLSLWTPPPPLLPQTSSQNQLTQLHCNLSPKATPLTHSKQPTPQNSEANCNFQLLFQRVAIQISMGMYKLKLLPWGASYRIQKNNWLTCTVTQFI